MVKVRRNYSVEIDLYRVTNLTDYQAGSKCYLKNRALHGLSYYLESMQVARTDVRYLLLSC